MAHWRVEVDFEGHELAALARGTNDVNFLGHWLVASLLAKEPMKLTFYVISKVGGLRVLILFSTEKI